MNGVDSFVSQNFSDHDSTFSSCIQLIIYSYGLIEKNKVYSRKAIQDLTTTIRGKKSNKIELEDFLRNDLVTNYIEPHRSIFGLDYILFNSGAEEFLDNIKVGVLDIKVTSPLWNGNTYFIFECKRLNKSILDEYVTEGIMRFIKKGKYYPKYQNSIAGMISFLESVVVKKRIERKDVFTSIHSVLLKYKDDIKYNGTLMQYKLDNKEFNFIGECDYIYLSKHDRFSSNIPIDIFHIILDYNHLITD